MKEGYGTLHRSLVLLRALQFWCFKALSKRAVRFFGWRWREGKLDVAKLSCLCFCSATCGEGKQATCPIPMFYMCWDTITRLFVEPHWSSVSFCKQKCLYKQLKNIRKHSSILLRGPRSLVCFYFICLFCMEHVKFCKPQDSYLVDPASSHMLVSKIKPCMSKYK